MLKKAALILGIVIMEISIVVEEEKKVSDINKFLENIRQSIKTMLEKTRMKKKKKGGLQTFNKTMVRRKLMEKFTTYPSYHQVVIDVKKGVVSEHVEKNKDDKKDESFRRIGGSNTFRKVLEKNQLLNPFLLVFPSHFNKALDRRADGRQSKEEADIGVDTTITEFAKAIEEYFKEVFRKSLLFWEIFEKLFVMDARRFKYLSFVLCGNETGSEIELDDSAGFYTRMDKEVQYSVFSGDYNFLPERDRFLYPNPYVPIWVRLEKWIRGRGNIPYTTIFTPLNPFKYRKGSKQYDYVLYPLKNELYEGSLYTGYLTSHLAFQHLLRRKKKSLCYYVSALAERGKYFAKVFMSELPLLQSYIGNKNNSSLQSLTQIIPRTIRFFESYFYGINYIYIQKILPEVVQMCYIKCLCENIGIKCGLEVPKTPEDMAGELLILLLYEVGGFKGGIEEFQSYLESIRYLIHLLGEMKCLENIKKDIEKIKEELKKFLKDRVQIGTIESYRKDEIEEIISFIETEDFEKALHKIYENFSQLFIEIFKTGYINNINTATRKWNDIILRGVEQKDKCYLDFVYTMVRKEIKKNRQNNNIPFLSYLISKKIDASVADLHRYTLFDSSLFSINMNTLLSYLSILDYKIYAWLSYYKEQRCYFDEQDEQLKDVISEIEKFECIFNDNKMNIGCYVERDYVFQNTKSIQGLFKGLLNSLDVNLSNLREKFNEIVGEGVKNYADTIGEVTNFLQLCEQVASFSEVVAIWERRMFEDKVIKGCYIPNLCGDRRCIEIVKGELCLDPLPLCNSIQGNQARLCITNFFNTLYCLNCFTSSPDGLYERAYKETGFSDILRKSSRCGTGSEPDRTYRKNACEATFKLYNDVCKVLEVEKCKGNEIQIRSCVSENMHTMETVGKICNSLSDRSPDISNIFFKNIKEKMASAHFSLLEKNITPAKLKEFYSRYKQRTICQE